MAEWKVIADRIQTFPHPNADNLLLAKVGLFQLVIGKDNGYQDGDIVVFAPERSLLPDDLKGDYCNKDTGLSYLRGEANNHVQRVRLRGEYSEGVTINPAYVQHKLGVPLDQLSLDTDLSAALGITKYEAPLPADMAGVATPLRGADWRAHDVEQFRLHSREFAQGEPVVVTEKIHGSQMIVCVAGDGTIQIASKGIFKHGLAILEDAHNLYWQALANSGLRGLIAQDQATHGAPLQLFGEAFPCQGKGFTYGQAAPTLRLFRYLRGGEEYPLAAVPEVFRDLWVPVLYQGPYDPDACVALARGKEQVSGKETGIREGVVISPAQPRTAARGGFPLYLKVISPQFKDSEEFIS